MRCWLACCVAVVAVAATVLSPAASQDKQKKERPKRVAITDPKEAGPDFAVQGEYEGAVPNGKLGAQVVAKGDGRFDVVLIDGGLPGADNPGKLRKSGKAETSGDRVLIKGENFEGDIAGGVMTIRVGDKSGMLKHVVRQSPTLGMKAPREAMVLFDGTEESAKNWQPGKIVEGNLLQMGTKSKQKFKDYTLHIEFRLPYMPYSSGQGRGNSGVYMQDRYEIQVLDSFGLKGLNNECAGIYSQFAPDVNMCFPPLSWQTYDVDFTAARFADGKRVHPAQITLRHNGVLVHDKREPKSETGGGQKEDDTPGPIQLQNHGDPVYYRNIWVVEKR